jgi:hypothetical protein
MRADVAAWPIGTAVVLALASGCGEELGPVRFRTTRVAGVVREGSRPVRGGWVEFLPVEGTVGNVRSAPIRGDGTFAAEGVAVGRNAIGIAGAPLNPALSHDFHPFRTPIRRDIPAGLETRLSIDLYEEAFRARERRAGERTPESAVEP